MTEKWKYWMFSMILFLLAKDSLRDGGSHWFIWVQIIISGAFLIAFAISGVKDLIRARKS